MICKSLRIKESAKCPECNCESRRKEKERGIKGVSDIVTTCVVRILTEYHTWSSNTWRLDRSSVERRAVEQRERPVGQVSN